MALTIAIFILALLAVVLIYAATKPDKFHVERTMVIGAQAERVYSLINDLRNWPVWSPYEKLDPGMKRVHSGSPSGKGAAYAWEGNGKVGAGNMTITNSVPYSVVAIDLAMLKPFKSRSDVVFRLQPEASGVSVTWAMDGKYAFPMKVMSIFMNMDKVVGGQFEEGLANLKRVAEEPSATQAGVA